MKIIQVWQEYPEIVVKACRHTLIACDGHVKHEDDVMPTVFAPTDILHCNYPESRAESTLLAIIMAIEAIDLGYTEAAKGILHYDLTGEILKTKD